MRADGQQPAALGVNKLRRCKVLTVGMANVIRCEVV
jgi:hypothetical protein